MTSRRLGGVVVQLRFDYAVTIVTDADLQIRIQGPFHFIGGHGATLLIDPEDVRGKGYADLLLELFDRAIDDITHTSDGTLTISFGDGHRIVAGPGQDYESWTISGPGTALVVCTVGGGVAVWPDAAESPPSRPCPPPEADPTGRVR